LGLSHHGDAEASRREEAQRPEAASRRVIRPLRGNEVRGEVFPVVRLQQGVQVRVAAVAGREQLEPAVLKSAVRFQLAV